MRGGGGCSGADGRSAASTGQWRGAVARGGRSAAAVAVRAVWRPALRPRLSCSVLGLGSRARNGSWGWGAWLPRLASPRVVRGGCTPELAPAGWVTPPAGQASLGAPVCVLGCSGTQGLVGESSCFLGASRPRGIPAGHTWPELRPGTGLTQPSGLWVASGSPTCLRACRVESENSSCCLLVPGFSRSVRPDLELRTPILNAFSSVFVPECP